MVLKRLSARWQPFCSGLILVSTTECSNPDWVLLVSEEQGYVSLNSLRAHNPNLLEIHLARIKNKHHIRSQFCTCHDSSAVVTCANMRLDWSNRIEIGSWIIFTRFQLWAHQPFVKWVNRALYIHWPAGLVCHPAAGAPTWPVISEWGQAYTDQWTPHCWASSWVQSDYLAGLG